MGRSLEDLRKKVLVINIITVLVVAGFAWLTLTNSVARDFLFQERTLPLWLQEVCYFLFNSRPETNMMATLVVWPIILPMLFFNAQYIRRKREKLNNEGLWEGEKKKIKERKKKVFYSFLLISLVNILFIVLVFNRLVSTKIDNEEPLIIALVAGVLALLVNVAITIISRL